jgi:hypothetical protein
MGLRRTVVAGLSVGLIASLAPAGEAFAEPPEFGRCVAVAKGTGKYATSKCGSQTAGGSFEWLQGSGVKNKFTLNTVAGKRILLETVGFTKFTCSAGKAEGEYTGAKTVRLATRFEGCMTSGGVATSPGEPSGVVVLKPLDGSLGIVKKGETAARNKVALDFSPEEAGGPVSQFSVGGIPIQVKGRVITHELVINAMKTSAPVKFVELKGKQKPESFEGMPRDVLETTINGGAPEQSGLGWETTQTNEEAIETNTVF